MSLLASILKFPLDSNQGTNTILGSIANSTENFLPFVITNVDPLYVMVN